MVVGPWQLVRDSQIYQSTSQKSLSPTRLPIDNFDGEYLTFLEGVVCSKRDSRQIGYVEKAQTPNLFLMSRDLARAPHFS